MHTSRTVSICTCLITRVKSVSTHTSAQATSNFLKNIYNGYIHLFICRKYVEFKRTHNVRFPSSLAPHFMFLGGGIDWIQTDKGACILYMYLYTYIYIYAECRLNTVHPFLVSHIYGLNRNLSFVYMNIRHNCVKSKNIAVRYGRSRERSFHKWTHPFLCDLACHETLHKHTHTYTHTGATGDRLKETQAINKSLSALGDVFTGKLFQIVSSLLIGYRK